MADYPVTLSSGRKSVLSDIERAVHGYSVKYTIPYTDVAVTSATGTGDTVTVTLGALPTAWFVNRAIVNVTTAFAGTTAVTLVVGTTTTTNAFVTSQSVTASPVVLGMNSTLPILTTATATASKNMVAIFTNAGGALASLSAGNANIYLNVVNVATDLP